MLWDYSQFKNGKIVVLSVVLAVKPIRKNAQPWHNKLPVSL